MARFGEFCACRENFVPLWPPTTRARRTLYHMRDGREVSRYNRTPGVAGVESTGGSGESGRGAGTCRQDQCEPHSTAGMEGAGGTGGHSRGPCGRRQGQAAVPVGGSGAWPGFEATHPATRQRPGNTGVEGAGGSGGHGRASRSTLPSRRLACGDLAGGRARRRPEHPWSHKQQQAGRRRPRAHQAARPNKAHAAPEHRRQQAPQRHTQAYKKPTSAIGCRPVVELGGFEPPTFSLRTRRATNCAIAPRTQTA